MEPILFRNYNSPLGDMMIASFGEHVVMADWRYRRMRSTIDRRMTSFFNTKMETGTSVLIQKTIQQLNEYFEKKRTQFDLPLLFAGTPFQQSVWHQLQTVPYGRTLSYAELSSQMQQPEAIRAIASANGANAISIIVPCHRIVGSRHELVGYAGGLEAKKKLLMLEGSQMQLEMF